MKESVQLHLWKLNSTSNSPVAPPEASAELSDFRQSPRSGNECECEQTLKKRAKGNDVSLLMSSPPISISHRHFFDADI